MNDKVYVEKERRYELEPFLNQNVHVKATVVAFKKTHHRYIIW